MYLQQRDSNFFVKILTKSNHRPSYPELFGRLQDLLSRDTIPEFFYTSSINEGEGKNDYTGESRGDAKKESDRSSAICKLNFHSPKKSSGFRTVINLKNLNSYVEQK